MSYMIGVDVGGTFTDFSVFDTNTNRLLHFKYSSTPDDASRAIVEGLKSIMSERGIQAQDISYLAHGTTVATNALIEKKGARLALVTTKGFKDLMEIGWQKRPSLYDLLKPKPENLIALGMKGEVEERILYDGNVKTALDEEGMRRLVRYFKEHRIQSIAVCTLFSFINPIHEKRIRQIIAEEYPEAYVSISSELVPEFREYSRMSTTVLNAYLGPVMERYVRNFETSVAEVGVAVAPYITQSNGSIISIAETIDCPIRTAVSGPSAGVIGAAFVGQQCGINKIISFDMGGTSADISLIENNEIKLSNERLIEGYPARIPMIDIVTIGAGGGSIARIDDGGALKVGPRSAGAMPGPACYMRGGIEPTVSDANIVLGKLNQTKILGGRMPVDVGLARKALEEQICAKSTLDLKRAAAGIISVVNSNMVRAIRVVSVERGYDVREFTLMAFGGAGPLHACEVAKDIGITQVLIPPSPGTLCALGLLMADTRFDFSRTNMMIAEPANLSKVASIFSELILEGDLKLGKQGVPPSERTYTCVIDCRYERQNYEIPVCVEPGMSVSDMACMIEHFHAEHNRAYGYFNKKMRIQMVNYRVAAVGAIMKPSFSASAIDRATPLPEAIDYRKVLFDGLDDERRTPVYLRDDIKPGCSIDGPAIIEQMDSTSVIPPAWTAYTDGFHNIIVRYGGKP